MDEKIITLSKYRLQKAKEDLEAAKLNFENKLFKASINRSYYAIFHGIRAVNAIKQFDSKKHSGVISYFNQNFIHTGIFDKNVYKLITSAYKIREKSDYDDFYIATKEEAEKQLKNAEKFLLIIEEYLNKKVYYDTL
ncbi:hypothetical protein ciss_11310 [Carboxydothermus islandicus]|uniref:HEPN domain-containing protein n=1 Tax=Carboxydothermus islandicus TaxID=661089 RepID=A0A1L8D204_9THEO|nr:HEPN domain-containing protein [Carboxydothermus islandicus]GAV25198.1 hypothetical protein ciss_11310 [Carboxydothermus islandicus]